MENPITTGELYDLAHSRKHGEDGKVALKYAKVSIEVADRIHKELGLDVHGFVHRMDEQFIRHADGGHDADGEWRKAQVPITRTDYENIERVVESPDKIAVVGKTKQGLPIIQFKKQVNGHLLVLEACHDGKKYLNFVTMYKHVYEPKKGEAR